MANLPCDRCGSSNAVEPYENGDFCFSCHTKDYPARLKLESDIKKQKNPRPIKLTTLSDFWVNWLKNEGIHDDTIKYFNLHYDELSQSLAYPIKIQEKTIGYQLRDKQKKIKTVRYLPDTEPFLFECRANNDESLVIVEDPISAMRIWQDTKNNCVSLLGTNLRAINRLYLIQNYKKFIVWMDGDLAGYEATQRITCDIQQICPASVIFTCRDPKKYTANELNALLRINE